jgi:hypothetical protein
MSDKSLIAADLYYCIRRAGRIADEIIEGENGMPEAKLAACCVKRRTAECENILVELFGKIR